jgi:Family of unknown function (DUF6152)
MRSKSSVILAWTLGLLFAAIPVLAHHSAAAQYDMENEVTITGVLVRVEWQNPHNFYYIDTKGADGEVTHWALEGAPPSKLFRAGVQRSSMEGLVGSKVTITGHAARDGSKNMFSKKMTLADNKDIPI